MLAFQEKVEQTIQAYQHGAFPMAEEGDLSYYTCSPRSVYFFDSFYCPRRLLRTLKKKDFKLRIDTSFDQVVEGCRRDRPEWISEELVAIYMELFLRGHAHSFEAWSGEKLVGGIYGTHFGAAFHAESMFHTSSGASDFCLIQMMKVLEKNAFHFCDIQYENEHTRRFKPTDVEEEDWLTILAQALSDQAEISI